MLRPAQLFLDHELVQQHSTELAVELELPQYVNQYSVDSAFPVWLKSPQLLQSGDQNCFGRMKLIPLLLVIEVAMMAQTPRGCDASRVELARGIGAEESGGRRSDDGVCVSSTGGPKADRPAALPDQSRSFLEAGRVADELVAEVKLIRHNLNYRIADVLFKGGRLS